MTARSVSIRTARQWLTFDHLYIDTETTGLDRDAQIVDIAVINGAGETILNTLVRPTCPIPPDATDIHGITDAMVAKAPTWMDVWPLLHALIQGKTIYAYNADFDQRMINQTLIASGFTWDHVNEYNTHYATGCVMNLFARYYGDWSGYHRSYRWQPLSFAESYCGLAGRKAHRALGDALAARAVLLHMAETKEEDEDEHEH